jgi:short-subunit dehydrogenase
MGGRLAVPLYSVYHATKWAVEGFSESLRYELEPLGIQVKLIEPGAIATEFGGRSADSTSQTSPIDYRSFTENAFANMRKMASAGTSEMVANVIFEAATDGSSRLRYIAGTDAKQFLGLRWFLPESVFAYVVRSMVLKPAKA